MMEKQLRSRHKSLLMLGMVGLVFVSLACSLWTGGAKTVRIKNTLATLTPTAAAIAQGEAPAAAVVQQPGASPAAPQAAPQSGAATATPIQKRRPILTPTPLPAAVAQAPEQPVEAVAAVPTAIPLSDPGLDPTPAPGTDAAPVSNSPTQPASPVQNGPVGTPPPTATLPPPPDPTDIPQTEVDGWIFRGVQTSLDQGQAVVVGELINKTGAPQQAVDISGIFYNAKDQVIQDEIDTLSYVPADVVPVGAHIPFELVIESTQSIYRLDLVARSAPATASPRQDFKFANVSQWTDELNTYCLDGEVQNTGLPLGDYLVVMAIAYNEQGNVVSFGEYSPVLPNVVVGDQISPFEMCIDPLNQNIARHELRALGY